MKYRVMLRNLMFAIRYKDGEHVKSCLRWFWHEVQLDIILFIRGDE